MKYSIAFLALFGCSVQAHEMTPAYPVLEQSFVEGVLQTNVKLFNRRSDINYYEISVYDNQWEPMLFATESNIVRIDYLKKKTIEIYLRSEDAGKAGWICTKSKITKGEATSVVSSRICSKIKSE